jgi:UDP-N-acetylmuramyl pentapeptide phosphotransferase/UDP-N-acetylglucosamine-1-phosphate transferase
MASGDGGSAFLGFVIGAMVVIVALIGTAIYTGSMSTQSISQASIDMPRPTLPSNPR